MTSPRTVLPTDIIRVIAFELADLHALATLAKVALVSAEINSIVTPVLYGTLKLRSDDDDSILLDNCDTRADICDAPPHGDCAAKSQLRSNPTEYIKHLIIAHFPSLAMCKRVHALMPHSSVTLPVRSTQRLFCSPPYKPSNSLCQAATLSSGVRCNVFVSPQTLPAL
jgi:hypothetical protein